MNNFVVVACIGCLSANLIVRQYPIHGQNVDDTSNFGYLGQAQLGTSNNSTASGVTQQMTNVLHWTPPEGPIVTQQLVLNHKAHLMESEEEIRNG